MVSKPIAKKSSKQKNEKKDGDDDKKKRRKKGEPTYGSYIYKVLKQVHPEFGISSKAVKQMNSILGELLERFAHKSAEVAHCTKKSTLGARHVQAAVPLLMGAELSKHAVSEATKAVTKYAS